MKVSVSIKNDFLTKILIVFKLLQSKISKYTLSTVVQLLQFLSKSNFIRMLAQILSQNLPACGLDTPNY